MLIIRRVKRRNGLSHGFTRKVGCKIWDLHAKDSHSFGKRLRLSEFLAWRGEVSPPTYAGELMPFDLFDHDGEQLFFDFN